MSEAEISPLRRWRIENDLRLVDVADLSGYSIAMLSRVERGEATLSPLDRVQLARRLGVRVADLFEVVPRNPVGVESDLAPAVRETR